MRRPILLLVLALALVGVIGATAAFADASGVDPSTDDPEAATTETDEPAEASDDADGEWTCPYAENGERPEGHPWHGEPGAGPMHGDHPDRECPYTSDGPRDGTGMRHGAEHRGDGPRHGEHMGEGHRHGDHMGDDHRHGEHMGEGHRFGGNCPYADDAEDAEDAEDADA